MSKPKREHTVSVPIDLVKDLLTDSERRMVKQRLLIMNLLSQGLPIRMVAEQAKVGTDTVVRMARKLESSPKLRQFLNKHKPSLTSKWVFGQVGVEK